ncbi:DNA methyltransferase [Sphingobacterium thalpophilum]|uniref:DNA methyltransferase n=1 Tax=Sphingobacterium thalpophilum TaxID=259 RepID=UPI0024A73C38|nr:DNA methyltransferase [Sphingobacterium thalpophilum]
MKITDKLTITNEDNMLMMARYPDKYFDLAIVDPPYGIGIASKGTIGGKGRAKAKNYGAKLWDNKTPDQKYFNELFRVSKNQIIWGANHFISKMPFDSSCWIVWDKINGETDFADCELAWSSFESAVRQLRFMWNGFNQSQSFSNPELPHGNHKIKEQRIHPTQKPVALYKWLLDKYAKKGDKILDTHLGSGSIAIACHDYGFELTACELDKEYYDKAVDRIRRHTNQLNLFTP